MKAGEELTGLRDLASVLARQIDRVVGGLECDFLESLPGMGETPRLQAKPSGGLRYDGRLCANCVEPPTRFIVCTTTSCSPRSIASRSWWGRSATRCGI